MWIDTQEYCMHDKLTPKGLYTEARDIFKFWEISNNILEMVQDVAIVATEDY